jgi:uncharacterized protein YkwD
MKRLGFALLLLFAGSLLIEAHPAQGTTVAAYCQSWRERKMLDLVNDHRQARGFPRISTSRILGAAAEHHSKSMAYHDYFSHYLQWEGITWTQNISQHGYPPGTWRGEVIAAASGDPKAIFNAWLHSPAHDAVMLSPDANEMGIGLVYRSGSTYGWYWTIDSGSANTANAPYC